MELSLIRKWRGDKLLQNSKKEQFAGTSAFCKKPHIVFISNISGYQPLANRTS